MTSVTKTELDRVPTKRDWLVPFLSSLVLALMSLAFSAYAGYNNNDKVTAGKVSAMENQQKNDGQRLDRIENKIDRLLEKVK